jgi:hypothetical protein
MTKDAGFSHDRTPDLAAPATLFISRLQGPLLASTLHKNSSEPSERNLSSAAVFVCVKNHMCVQVRILPFATVGQRAESTYSVEKLENPLSSKYCEDALQSTTHLWNR